MLSTEPSPNKGSEKLKPKINWNSGEYWASFFATLIQPKAGKPAVDAAKSENCNSEIDTIQSYEQLGIPGVLASSHRRNSLKAIRWYLDHGSWNCLHFAINYKLEWSFRGSSSRTSVLDPKNMLNIYAYVWYELCSREAKRRTCSGATSKNFFVNWLMRTSWHGDWYARTSMPSSLTSRFCVTRYSKSISCAPSKHLELWKSQGGRRQRRGRVPPRAITCRRSVPFALLLTSLRLDCFSETWPLFRASPFSGWFHSPTEMETFLDEGPRVANKLTN